MLKVQEKRPKLEFAELESASKGISGAMEGKEKEESSSSSDEQAEAAEEPKKKKGWRFGGGKKHGGGGGKGMKKPAKSVLTPDEIGRMVDLGLGRGVDATSHSPWLNKTSFQVREVTPYNIIGTDEGEVLQSYSHEVSSVQSMQTSMSASVPVSQQVSVGIDAELSRSYSTNRRSVGKKIITRSISYRADFDDLKKTGRPSPLSSISSPPGRQNSSASSGSVRRQSSSIQRSLSIGGREVEITHTPTFEERLAKWILERLYEEEVEGVEELDPDDDPTEVLNNFIAEWKQDEKIVKQKIGQKCREFINHFHITHYVSSIELGASKYRVMSEEDYNLQVGTKGNVGVEQMASVAVEQKMSFGRRSKSSELTQIGRFDKDHVKRGTCAEAVVGVKFQPISALVMTRILRNKLQNAIKNYIDNQEHSKSGPFIISCNDETIFLKVTADFKVVGTSNIEESSDFFISSNEDGDSAYEFSIMYMAPSPLGAGIKPIARYLYAPVNSFGRNHGPLELRLDAKDSKTKMTLHSRRIRHFRPVDTKDWVSSSDIYYLNCKHRSVKRNGYICVRHATEPGVDAEFITCCVPSIKKHDESRDHFMLFRLIRAAKRDPKKRNRKGGEGEEEDNEPMGVGRKGRKTSGSIIESKRKEHPRESDSYLPKDELETIGEDTVDTPKKEKGGGGKGGKGGGRGEGGKGKKGGGGGGGGKGKRKGSEGGDGEGGKAEKEGNGKDEEPKEGEEAEENQEPKKKQEVVDDEPEVLEIPETRF